MSIYLPSVPVAHCDPPSNVNFTLHAQLKKGKTPSAESVELELRAGTSASASSNPERVVRWTALLEFLRIKKGKKVKALFVADNEGKDASCDVDDLTIGLVKMGLNFSNQVFCNDFRIRNHPCSFERLHPTSFTAQAFYKSPSIEITSIRQLHHF